MKNRQNIKELVLRTNSVKTLPAQSTRLLHHRTAIASASSTNNSIVAVGYHLTGLELLVIELSTIYGLRISEILSLNANCVTRQGHLIVPGAKGSSNRVIININNINGLQELRLMPYRIGQLYSRFYFYRLFKRLGIVFDNGKGRNKSVTHAGRKYLANDIYSMNRDISSVSVALGHKSNKSSEYYINGIRTDK